MVPAIKPALCAGGMLHHKAASLALESARLTITLLWKKISHLSKVKQVGYETTTKKHMGSGVQPFKIMTGHCVYCRDVFAYVCVAKHEWKIRGSSLCMLLSWWLSLWELSGSILGLPVVLPSHHQSFVQLFHKGPQHLSFWPKFASLLKMILLFSLQTHLK